MILESEWQSYVATDMELVITGVAEHTNPIGEVIRITSPLLTEWNNHSSGSTVWFSYFEGNLSVKSPDEEVLQKMRQIAKSLNAFIRGDEGERYDLQTTEIETKAWWKRLF
jgi:hypothetical protein